jgi:homoserine dehydrogenase
MSTVAAAVRVHAHPDTADPLPAVRVALLGLGHVGSAVASLAREVGRSHGIAIAGALVRDASRARGVESRTFELSADPDALFASAPDVVVEVLGGLEPARTLVLAAIGRGIPVVTANKSLLAHHGDEILEAASQAGVPLRYEASVLAGVPFLGTLARRPMAAEIDRIAGILNGTSNFVLSKMAAGRIPLDQALDVAQRLGYAEPDPENDVTGRDAVEKLCVLLRHCGGWSVQPAEVERSGLDGLTSADLEHASALGGVIRPLAAAEWSGGAVTAFAGPAFVPAGSLLARVDGVQNAVALRSRRSGDLFFSGPGAGPDATAATLLDDVLEVSRETAFPTRGRRRPVPCGTPQSGWFVRLASTRLPEERDVADLLGAHGVWMRRTSERDTRDGIGRQWLLTHSCARARLDRALAALTGASGCDTFRLRAVAA